MAAIVSFLWNFVKTLSNNIYNKLFSEEHPTNTLMENEKPTSCSGGSDSGNSGSGGSGDDHTERPGKTSTKPTSEDSGSGNPVEQPKKGKPTSNSGSDSGSGDDSTKRPGKTSTKPTPKSSGSEDPEDPHDSEDPEGPEGPGDSGSGDSVEQLEKKSTSTPTSGSSGGSGGTKPKKSTSTSAKPPKSTSTSKPTSGSCSGPGSAWESGFWTSPDHSKSDTEFFGTDSNDILDSGPGRTLILLPDVKGTQVGHLLYVQMQTGFRIIVNRFKEDLPPHLLGKGQREKDIHALKVALRENKEFLKDRKFRLLLTSIPVFLFLLNASPDQLEFLEDFSFSLAFANKNEKMFNSD